jgi:hypothetical protein
MLNTFLAWQLLLNAGIKEHFAKPVFCNTQNVMLLMLTSPLGPAFKYLHTV